MDAPQGDTVPMTVERHLLTAPSADRPLSILECRRSTNAVSLSQLLPHSVGSTQHRLTFRGRGLRSELDLGISGGLTASAWSLTRPRATTGGSPDNARSESRFQRASDHSISAQPWGRILPQRSALAHAGICVLHTRSDWLNLGDLNSGVPKPRHLTRPRGNQPRRI